MLEVFGPPRLPYLCILDYKMSRGEDESDQRGGEEHLDDGNIPVITAKDLGERVGVVDAEALGGAWRARRGLRLARRRLLEVVCLSTEHERSR